tara:strand:- start:12682 stop:13563 length:882 start_codon:yes stop_codon:yes gene_type:complete
MKPYLSVRVWQKKINFFNIENKNLDNSTVASFGNEWEVFSDFEDEEINFIAKDYFDIVNDEDIENKIVLDAGCGSGRWTKYIVKKAKHVELVDPSEAIFVAAKLLKKFSNVSISHASIDQLPFKDEHFDFIISLGVIHHIPNMELALKHLTSKLKKDGKILLYIYYNLENRSIIYKAIFTISSVFRFLISKLPFMPKKIICEIIAIIIYYPLSKFSNLILKLGFKNISKKIPLEYYKDKSIMIMRNDALDRFGTPLEQRFSKKYIEEILKKNNYKNITFSKHKPYYHLIATKR